jgi:hypothetical protein
VRVDSVHRNRKPGVNVSDSQAVLVEFRVQRMDDLNVSSGLLDCDIALLINRLDLIFNLMNIRFASVKCSLETSDGSQMSLEAVVVVDQVMFENNQLPSQSPSGVVPVVDSVAPYGISGSVGSDSDGDVVHGHSVSVDCDSVSFQRQSEGVDHILFLSDGTQVVRNLRLIDVGSVQLNIQRMSQTVNGLSVLDDESSVVVDSVDMNVDGSSVDNDFVSEGVDFCSVSVDHPSVSHDFVVLIITFKLSSLGN